MNSASDARSGKIEINNISGNDYTFAGNVYSGASSASCGGLKSLSGVLDRIRITTVNGTDTFDAGSINIMYEG
jgi:hypothetical protein